LITDRFAIGPGLITERFAIDPGRALSPSSS
jgi:hypothetical protein